MKIAEQKWNEIIAETQASIDTWKAHATESGRDDKFHCEVVHGLCFDVLMTEHRDGWRTLRKAIAREQATGELRSAKAKEHKGRIKFSVTTPDPKAWASLPDKPAKEIVSKLKLASFTMAKMSSAYADIAESRRC